MTSAYGTLLACALPVLTATHAFAQGGKSEAPPPPAEEHLSIEELLKGGWQIAGFTSTFDNRSALILFHNPAETTLVQCLSGYDVTRTPRIYSNCYRLR
jgi:hypothetical protein